MGRLGSVSGPFVMLLGYVCPGSVRTGAVTRRLDSGCNIPIATMGYLRLYRRSVGGVLSRVLFRFPVGRIKVYCPG